MQLVEYVLHPLNGTGGLARGVRRGEYLVGMVDRLLHSQPPDWIAPYLQRYEKRRRVASA
jgi:hypothetical protein